MPADPATKDLSRLYFLPDAPEGAECFAESTEGKPLDIKALLASPRTTLPLPLPPATVDMQYLATLLRRNHLANDVP